MPAVPRPPPAPDADPAPHRTEFAVRYHETDQMGVVHHSVYVHYFEIGRTEAMSSLGIDYAQCERDGLLLAVIDVGLRYRAPARFGDRLRVESWVSKLERVRVRIDYRVLRAEDGELLCTGHSVLAATAPGLKPRRLPPQVREAFGKLLIETR